MSDRSISSESWKEPDGGQPVLVLGMHRSGTSFLASFLQSLGVFLGEHLVGARRGNPRGHFEDEAVLEFHQKALAARLDPEGWLFDEGMMRQSPLHFEPTPEEYRAARELLEGRRRAGWWGWKEPRTCLFLPFWQGQMPHLRGIIVYRHPLEVHLSMLRRVHWDLSLFPGQVLRSYSLYNEPLIEAARAYPENYLVLHAGAAFADIGELEGRLRVFLGQSAKSSDCPEFHPSEFHTLAISRDRHALFAEIAPEAASTFEALQDCASLPMSWADGDSGDDNLRQLRGALKPFLDGACAGQRACLIPAFEVLWSGFDRSEVLQFHGEIIEGIRTQKFSIDRWREEMLSSWRAQQRLLDEQKRAWENEVGRTKEVWAELRKVGKSWEQLRDIVVNQQERIAQLEQELQAAKAQNASEFSNTNPPPHRSS